MAIGWNKASPTPLSEGTNSNLFARVMAAVMLPDATQKGRLEMNGILSRLRYLYRRTHFSVEPLRKRRNAPEYHVIVPHDVQLPHPKSTIQEICVPASINGRDMSTGRL